MEQTGAAAVIKNGRQVRQAASCLLGYRYRYACATAAAAVVGMVAVVVVVVVGWPEEGGVGRCPTAAQVPGVTVGGNT